MATLLVQYLPDVNYMLEIGQRKRVEVVLTGVSTEYQVLERDLFHMGTESAALLVLCVSPFLI